MDNASILITGGTDSLGKALIEFLLKEAKVARIAIYSRDELKQSALKNIYGDNLRLRWFLADIRDLDRLKRALHGAEY